MGQLIYNGGPAVITVPGYGIATRGGTYTYPDDVASQLVAESPGWWTPTSGFVPSAPAQPPATQPFGPFCPDLWLNDRQYSKSYVVRDSAGVAWVALQNPTVGVAPSEGAQWTQLTAGGSPGVSIGLASALSLVLGG